MTCYIPEVVVGGFVLILIDLFVCSFISYHLLSPKSAGSQVTVLSAPVQIQSNHHWEISRVPLHLDDFMVSI